MLVECSVCRRIKDLNIQISSANEKCRKLEHVIEKQKNTIQELQLRPDLATSALNSLFNNDQVEILLCDKKQPKQWSDATITDSLKTRITCGKKGYKHEREKFPLPSERTLQRRMQNLNFNCGILDDVIDLLKLKLNTMVDEDLDCGNVFDEMSIEEAR